MTTLTFDTLAYSKKLRAVGFTEEQADVQAETINKLITDQLATKNDLKELELALKHEINDLKRDMKEMELRLAIKLGAIVTTGIVVVAALVKLL